MAPTSSFANMPLIVTRSITCDRLFENVASWLTRQSSRYWVMESFPHPGGVVVSFIVDVLAYLVKQRQVDTLLNASFALRATFSQRLLVRPQPPHGPARRIGHRRVRVFDQPLRHRAQGGQTGIANRIKHVAHEPVAPDAFDG